MPWWHEPVAQPRTPEASSGVALRIGENDPVGTPAKRSLSLGGAVRVAYPDPSSVAVTAVMRGNRSRDTRPEVLLRSALHRHGLRFRKDYRIRALSRSCRVDIVFTRPQVAVFVDGCFWHGCREHGRTPKSNTGYWEAKLARNAERDRENDTALTASGWTVVRVWEHEPVEEVVDRIARLLHAEGP